MFLRFVGEGGYKIRNQEAIHFITFATVEWIDVFTRADYRYIIIESLKFCQEEKGLILNAWVIMSNHIHLIGSAREGFKLSDILRDLKKHTSRKILEAINQNDRESRKEWMLTLFKTAGKKNSRNTCYQVWQQHNHPKELEDDHIIDQKLDYIHNNPVEAELVDDPEDYIFSSARDYSGNPGFLKVELLD